MPDNLLKKTRIKLTEKQKLVVYETLNSGSDPRGSFFLLVAVSTLIAAFGLVMNSTAVVIGAMLVAPLMTPILGLALALVRGDTSLLGRAVRSESVGVLVAIFASALLGFIMPYYEATPEMLSRTQPNLFDLLVAVFAGLAGAYALVNERLSPVLPGVAISTAIVPPLANVGLSLSLGYYKGAWGSFLLFFTNFLSILLVSAVIFFVAGMAEEMRSRKGITLARRFGVAVVGFGIITVLLSGELVRILDHRRIRNDAWDALKTELTDFGISDMERLLHKEHDGKILVLADVNGPKELTPRQVEEVQEQLSNIVKKPVRLYLRTTITHDVSAKGAISRAVVETLDGFFSLTEQSEQVKDLQVAEQIIREYLDTVLGVHLIGIDSIPTKEQTVMMATVEGVRHLFPSELGEIEKTLQKRLNKPNLWFIANQGVTELTDRYGGLQPETLDIAHYDKKRLEVEEILGPVAERWLEEHSLWLEKWSIIVVEGVYVTVLEVKGPEPFTQKNFDELHELLQASIDVPVKLNIRFRLESVFGPDEPMRYEDLLRSLMKHTKSENTREFQDLLQRVR